MPYSSNSRDTAPFGVAFQPGTGPLRRLRNVAMNWATEHGALADIQRFARRRLAEAGAPDFPGYFIDLQPKVVDAYLQEETRSLGMTKTRDLDVLRALVFFERLALANNNGRPRSRAFLDVLRMLSEPKPAANAAPSLILP